jgi:hypothetical protein
MTFDLNLVSREGLTITAGDIFYFNMEVGVQSDFYFGIGYHYIDTSWDIGASFICLRPDEYDDGLLGFKADASFWLTEGIGITGIVVYGKGVKYGGSLFNIQGGISVRL